MDRQIKVAVISDLHIGDQARAQDFCTKHDIAVHNKRFIEKDYFGRFKKHIEENGIIADYLFVSGDISSRADMRQFELGSELVCKIANLLKVDNKNIFFVPGNHDVDWSVFDLGADEEVRFSKRYDSILESENIFLKLNVSADGDLLKEPYIAVWENDEICVVAYNSAWNDTPKNTIHCGEIAREHITSLNQVIKDKEKINTKLKVFLVHHHPIQYSNPTSEHDFSAMQNADLLLEVLAEHKFDLFVHGHKHNPNVNVRGAEDGVPLLILGAGSFSVNLGTEWTESVHNQFHLIDIHGRQGDGHIKGKVYSWEYTSATGWGKSSLRTGIEYERAFGSYYGLGQIKTKVATKVREGIDTKQWIKWREIRSSENEFEYLSVKLVERTLKEIAYELDLTYLRNDDINEVMLLSGAEL